MDTPKLELEQLLLHGAWLRRFARALVGNADDADDVAQHALVSAWQAPPPVDAKPRSWLARVAQNRARDLRRTDQRRRRREREAEGAMADAATPEQLVGGIELHRQLAAVVTALDEPFRQTVMLRYYEGLSSAQIAVRMAVPGGTVRWRLKEGLERLRRALDNEHGGSRKKWMLAVAPLVPREDRQPAAGAARKAWVAPALAVAVMGVVGVVATKLPVQLPPKVREDKSARGPVMAEADLPPSAMGLPRIVVEATAEEAQPVSAADPAAADPEALVRYMLAALAAGSYADFLTYADDQLKAALDKDALANVAAEIGPRLMRGYTLHDLGTLKQEESLVYLWKLELAEGGDDHLLRVSIEAGRATGFLIQ